MVLDLVAAECDVFGCVIIDAVTYLSPSSVPELQAVLKIANKYVIPVWTISRGKNLGYDASSTQERSAHYLTMS